MYYICAKEFGWTIDETRNAPIHMLDWILQIHLRVGNKNDFEQYSRGEEIR